MPACSTCGLGVEWLRDCYQSEWRLFRDDLSIKTKGRYYFTPDDVPFVAGFHHLGSSTWYDRNNGLGQALGEDINPKRTKDDGAQPAVLPVARIVGSAACIAQGELAADAAPPATLIDGYPPQCFQGEAADVALWQKASSFDRCSLQRLYARIIDWEYADLEGRIIETFDEFLGPTCVTKVHPSSTFLPSVVTVIGPRLAIAVIDGTRNFEQLVAQALYSLGRPQDWGVYGTNKLWNEAANVVMARLQADGMQPNDRVMLAGHSYGAAVALVVAARLRAASPTRSIRYITYGCPKPGDARLVGLLNAVEGINLANDPDIITVLPPDELTLAPVMFFLGAPQLKVWIDWKRPPNQVLQNDDGSLSPAEGPALDFWTLVNIAQRVLAGQSFISASAHQITVYLERISLRCPDAVWPVDAEVSDLLDSPGDLRFQSLGTGEIGGDAVWHHAHVFDSIGGGEIGGDAVITNNSVVYNIFTDGVSAKFVLPGAGPFPGIAIGKNVVGPNFPVGTVITAVILPACLTNNASTVFGNANHVFF